MPNAVRLLRARGLRPGSRRAAEKSYEIPPLHVAPLGTPIDPAVSVSRDWTARYLEIWYERHRAGKAPVSALGY
jgi:hypothetical protein